MLLEWIIQHENEKNFYFKSLLGNNYHFLNMCFYYNQEIVFVNLIKLIKKNTVWFCF